MNAHADGHEPAEESMEVVKLGRDEPVGVDNAQHEVTLKQERDLDDEDIMEVTKYGEPKIVNLPVTEEAEKDAYRKQPKTLDSMQGRKINQKTVSNQVYIC